MVLRTLSQLWLTRLGRENTLIMNWKSGNEIVRSSSCINNKKFDLRKPINKVITSYGHMGREDEDVSWENADMVNKLKEYLVK